MIVDGKMIADTILSNLTDQTIELKGENIVPTLAVILAGDDPASLSYIRQKQKACDAIGAKLIFEHLPAEATREQLASTIAHYNSDAHVHGLIIQRPVPIQHVEQELQAVAPAKDIDGFLHNSAFRVPVARGVLTILKHIHTQLSQQNLIQGIFLPWLQKQSIAVIGRGETAGHPIAKVLTSYGCAISVIHSKTADPDEITKSASIIISCVGKKEVITKRSIAPGVILISVGLWRDEEGKLHGDYEENDIKNHASFYTPTPGGVGPVNVASLMQNLLEAVMLQSSA